MNTIWLRLCVTARDTIVEDEEKCIFLLIFVISPQTKSNLKLNDATSSHLSIVRVAVCVAYPKDSTTFHIESIPVYLLCGQSNQFYLIQYLFSAKYQTYSNLEEFFCIFTIAATISSISFFVPRKTLCPNDKPVSLPILSFTGQRFSRLYLSNCSLENIF